MFEPSTLAPMEVSSRIDKLRSALDGADCEALLVSNLVNIRYLTGFTGSAGMLLVASDDLLFVTDGRYQFQSAEQLDAAGVDARIVVGGGKKQKDALTGAASGIRRLGLESRRVTWSQQRTFEAEWFADAELVPTRDVVEELRRVKDRGEVERIRAAAHIADEAFAAVRPILANGITEADFAQELDFEIRRRGADGNSFDTIVASGPNGAKAHWEPSTRKIEEGELIVLDFGAIVDGYCSDMTRTVCVGAPRNETLERMVDVVAESQQAGVAAVRAGVSCAEIDEVCRDVIADAGWSDAFLHSTGHGVGLDIHEAPSVGQGSDDTLAAGYVVTVEPGVYLAEHGGVRIEDTVVVTDDGCEVLTQAPKVLQIA